MEQGDCNKSQWSSPCSSGKDLETAEKCNITLCEPLQQEFHILCSIRHAITQEGQITMNSQIACMSTYQNSSSAGNTDAFKKCNNRNYTQLFRVKYL